MNNWNRRGTELEQATARNSHKLEAWRQYPIEERVKIAPTFYDEKFFWISSGVYDPFMG